MDTCERLKPKLGISRTIDAFRKPLCPLATGKDILERFFGILHKQPRNCRDVNATALIVATELEAHWKEGDGRIPLKSTPTIRQRIVDFRETFRLIGQKSKKGRKDYAEAVN